GARRRNRRRLAHAQEIQREMLRLQLQPHAFYSPDFTESATRKCLCTRRTLEEERRHTSRASAEFIEVTAAQAAVLRFHLTAQRRTSTAEVFREIMRNDTQADE
ncbi:MAG: hypothetical protein LC742_02595, partial [Acidobacteria bacterium]|nr:hypothetical protein [Acidobacteriota bacterium]